MPISWQKTPSNVEKSPYVDVLISKILWLYRSDLIIPLNCIILIVAEAHLDCRSTVK